MGKKFIELGSENVVLIITGCINPNTNQRYLVLKDVNARLRQYVDCILFFLNSSPFKLIVFCDNSGYRYSHKDQIFDTAISCGKKFEWLSFKGNSDLVVKYSTKGIGEDEIMNYVFSNSSLITTAKTFVKITGRLVVNNVSELLAQAQYKKNYFYRNIYTDNFFEIDTRFYVMDIDFYKKNVRNCYSRIKDYDMSMELVYSKLIKHNYSLLPKYPRITGCSGGVGTDYGKESILKLLIFDALCVMKLFNHCSWVIILTRMIERKAKKISSVLLGNRLP